MSRLSARGISGLTVASALLAWAGTVGAQESTLDRADRLARSGELGEARALVLGWWEEERTSTSRADEQRALWLRGRLTVDPAQAMLDYRRLVVLYPTGLFADQALLRLAQAAHALGDADAARTHVAQLVRDYPGTEASRSGEAWLAAAGDPPARVGAAPGGSGTARPSDSGPPPPRSSGRASAEDATRMDPGTGAREYSVQLGAFGDPERARTVLDQAIEAGFEARLVRVEGSPLLHVRVGAYTVRDGAQTLLDRLSRASIEGAVVRDPRPERAASGG